VQVINKFNDILEQFAREIDTTVEIFEKHKDTPPVTKNQPPVAGAGYSKAHWHLLDRVTSMWCLFLIASPHVA
jgi:hypothetical protein